MPGLEALYVLTATLFRSDIIPCSVVSRSTKSLLAAFPNTASGTKARFQNHGRPTIGKVLRKRHSSTPMKGPHFPQFPYFNVVVETTCRAEPAKPRGARAGVVPCGDYSVRNDVERVAGCSIRQFRALGVSSVR